MIIPARVQFQQTALSLSDKDLEALVDTGSKIEALAGFELFDKGALEDAQRPVALIEAGKSRIKGGNQGVTVNLTLPVCKTDGSIVKYKCLRVFIYVADIGRKLILGFPFFLRYNLFVVPGMPSLMQVPNHTISMGNLNQCIMLIWYRFNHQSNQSRIMMKEFRYNATRLLMSA